MRQKNQRRIPHLHISSTRYDNSWGRTTAIAARTEFVLPPTDQITTSDSTHVNRICLASGIAAAMSKPVVADDRKELEDLILHSLDKHETIPNSIDFLSQHSLPLSTHTVLISTLQSLQSHALISLTSTDHTDYILTAEGEDSEARGTPEGRLIEALRDGGKGLKELEGVLGKDVLVIAQGHGMKGKWLQLDKEKAELKLKEGVEVRDEVRELLTRVKEGQSNAIDSKVLNELKKRKMIVQRSAHTPHYTAGGG